MSLNFAMVKQILVLGALIVLLSTLKISFFSMAKFVLDYKITHTVFYNTISDFTDKYVLDGASHLMKITFLEVLLHPSLQLS